MSQMQCLNRRWAGLMAAAVGIVCLAAGPALASSSALANINNVVVIYLENWSFDAQYGSFPGGNGLSNAGASATQIDLTGTAFGSPDSLAYAAGLPVLEKNVALAVCGTAQSECYIANQPFNLAPYLPPTGISTSDLPHKYYTEQLQIDGGKMDKFAVWDNTGLGLSMSYYDATHFPEGELAAQYTLCDNFFHGSFGGSFMNHLWLISAQPQMVAQMSDVAVLQDINGNFVSVTGPAAAFMSPPVPTLMSSPVDANLTRNQGDDIFYYINTTQPPFPPHSTTSYYATPLTTTTIGDLLSKNNVTWKWYSGGWDAANLSSYTAATDPDMLFQFHHQPFNYFAEFAPGSVSRSAHLLDESQFFVDLAGNTDNVSTPGEAVGSLPQVCFIKPVGANNEHPSYASIMQGQEHTAMLVNAIQQSPYWPHTLIIITYDEHGGRWDHVAPPGSAQMDPTIAAYYNANTARADVWGPGSRVPAILISPYVKTGVVDHTPYDTTSILALLENKFCGGARLGTRDAAVNSLELSLTTSPQQPLVLGKPNVQKTAFGPVPAHKGTPVCVFYERPVTSSHWDVYNLAGSKVSSLDFGTEPNPCWDSSAVAPGIYMIRSALKFPDGSSKTVWNKVIIQP
jgi:phospholipase C